MALGNDPGPLIGPLLVNVAFVLVRDPETKRGLAITPVKFGISFTRRTMNQANALVNVYLDGTVAQAVPGSRVVLQQTASPTGDGPPADHFVECAPSVQPTSTANGNFVEELAVENVRAVEI